MLSNVSFLNIRCVCALSRALSHPINPHIILNLLILPYRFNNCMYTMSYLYNTLHSLLISSLSVYSCVKLFKFNTSSRLTGFFSSRYKFNF
jgi:hypothetical protein